MQKVLIYSHICKDACLKIVSLALTSLLWRYIDRKLVSHLVLYLLRCFAGFMAIQQYPFLSVIGSAQYFTTIFILCLSGELKGFRL